MRVRIIHLSPEDRPQYQERVAALERLASYPLGDDRFELDHGDDYFAFFDRLGSVETYLALIGEQLVGMAQGILREVPLRAGGRIQPVWYLCDLKVDPAFRGRRIPFSILWRAFPRNYMKCRRAYAISMNPGDGRPNRVVKLASHWRLAPIQLAGELGIWSLDAEAMTRAAPIVTARRGLIGYRSLEGIKDLILHSTNARLPLRHVEYGGGGGLTGAPEPGATHMLCAARNDPLWGELSTAGLEPSATASILGHRMPSDCDWRFVLTSEI